MKTSQVIIGLAASIGVLLIGWYLYMQQTPTYERTFRRGLEVRSVKESASKEAPQAPKTATPVKAAPPAQPAPAAQPVKAAPAAKPTKTGPAAEPAQTPTSY